MKIETPSKFYSAILSEFSELIGPEATQVLVDQLGGTRIYIASAPAPRHKLVKLIGLEKSKILGAAYGNERVCIPLNRAANTKKLQILGSEGSIQEIARKVGCSERHVYQVRSNAGVTAQNQINRKAGASQ